MKTSRAYLWGIFRLVEIATIHASPDHLSGPLEDASRFQVVCQVTIALAMLFFGDGHGLEGFNDLLKTLLSGYVGKPGIHLSPFMLFPGRSGPQVLQGRTNGACGK